ncbi:MAG TPA: hypothetical protein VN516_00520 [Candidatus Baltobacteraceae bacterium]|nr:hypothetical protein [Candidatus Baltobacteraceae bacterium]
MKSSFFLLAAVGLLFAGCGKDSTATKAVNGVSNVVNAPLDYVSTVVAAEKSAQKTIDVSYINQDIQMFYASEGRYPKDLKEMVPNYLAKIPDAPYGYKIVYDTNAYTVKVVKQ